MFVRSSLLEKYEKLTHFFTTRQGGVSVGNFSSFNLSSFTGDDSLKVEENLSRLKEGLRLQDFPFFIPCQNHGTEVRVIDKKFLKLPSVEQLQLLNGVDALITQELGVCIGVTTADCVPLIIYDPVHLVVAVVHAGWRGTCAGIVERTLRLMEAKFDCKSSNLQVAIGPSISVDSYNVGDELIEKFREGGFPVDLMFNKKENQFYLDLWKANKWLLLKNGVLEENVHIMGICTFVQEQTFFSARRLGIQSGRMLTGAVLLT